ncbi:MAG TPA: hypothetical protein VK186_28500 [Candidatus Deferrimicrobium sp.]|nr:hypothetical protein [Candidatus Deferrimicrobium sp.]
MEIRALQLDELLAADKFLLSFPLKPEIYSDLKEKFPGLPFIMINRENEIIFSLDYYHFLISHGVDYADVLQMDITDKEALFLNYNLKSKLTGLNLYEKLVFIKKVSLLEPMPEAWEIYQKTGFDISLNRELLENLDLLLSTGFRELLTAESIGLKTGLMICSLEPGDREVLLELFAEIPFSTSHQLKIMEMVEEILFRDKCSLAEVFEKLQIGQYLEMEKPQKLIIDALFTYRNPIYMEEEARWEEEMKKLNLPANMKVTHYPFFEKRDIEVTIRLKNLEAFKELLGEMNDYYQGAFLKNRPLDP